MHTSHVYSPSSVVLDQDDNDKKIDSTYSNFKFASYLTFAAQIAYNSHDELSRHREILGDLLMLKISGPN